jgi:hypothetical protein
MTKVIIEYDEGQLNCYKATLKNATSLFNRYPHYISEESLKIAELIKNKKPYFNKKSIHSIVNKVLSKPIGESASKSITVSKEIKDETILYCFNKQIIIKNSQVDEYELFKDFKFENLSYFKNNPIYQSQAEIFESSDIDVACQIFPIIYNSWKTEDDMKKIDYILRFLQDTLGSHHKFELVDIESKI